MRPQDRIVGEMPLRELWDESGPIAGERGAFLDAEEIRALLRTGPVRFVVADRGPLRWVSLADCWLFWKSEVRDHLCPDGPIDLGAFTPEYCYFASIWVLATGEKVVLLESCH